MSASFSCVFEGCPKVVTFLQRPDGGFDGDMTGWLYPASGPGAGWLCPEHAPIHSQSEPETNGV